MIRKIMFATAIAIAALGLYAGFPRQADLRSFDPAAMARLETAMWRDYYEKRYAALFGHLYESCRSQFGFSPLDSVRIALYAALAARAFQPTHSRAEANAALPYLVSYYSLLRSAAPVAFESDEIARRELDWWQARRDASGPSDYGRTIAAVAALTYGKPLDQPDLVVFGVMRAEAMAYRDAHGKAITDTDWADIERQLRDAYERLRAGIRG